MEENTSLWSKKPEELTVSDQLKVAGLVTVATTVALYGGLWVVGTAIQLKERRALKKQEKLANVEDTTDEA